jgi:hypothetical protein
LWKQFVAVGKWRKTSGGKFHFFLQQTKDNKVKETSGIDNNPTGNVLIN